MITEGKPDIDILDDCWTIVTLDGKLAAHYEHTILVTEDGYEILTVCDE
jgi:methionyl aminopeptidase